ncbi:RING-H2 finger protein ATL39-like [Oryza brachyantha]|uniref:RING-H2 finger protein ATL39-like n=1 Tax=Oryza brachyantha TaxID=4533 RepID=UPI001ADCCC00|nr:RING-H2 finger protein ATL39-like [Oryza brachyantha]
MHLEMSPDSLLFFCSVTASAAAGFCLFSLYRRLARRCHAATAAAGGEEERPPPITVASSIPEFMYDRLVRHSGKGASWTECAVCLGTIQAGAMVKLLPACAHIYHVDCIDLWLSSHPTCPLCRCRVDHPKQNQLSPA